MLVPAQFGVDIFEEIARLITRKYELVIFQGILDELERIAKKSQQKQKQVDMALQLAKKCILIRTDINTGNYQRVDEILLQYASENNSVVATNDQKLRKKLRAHKIPCIFLRKKAYLAIEGDIPS